MCEEEMKPFKMPTTYPKGFFLEGHEVERQRLLKGDWKMEIEVTRKDLRNHYLDDRNCPIAQALKRAYSTQDVRVHARRVWIDGREIELPPHVDAMAMARANNLWGQIIGGFKFQLP